MPKSDDGVMRYECMFERMYVYGTLHDMTGKGNKRFCCVKRIDCSFLAFPYVSSNVFS